MSSLRERLEKRGREESIVTIRDERFKVIELPKSQRAEVLAANRDAKGKMSKSLDATFLSLCVLDPESGEPVYSSEESAGWESLGSGFTGPLMAEVMRLNGMDDSDVGREVKKSETAESSD